jgi:hypothetical protein
VEVDAEGKVADNRIMFSPVNTTKMRATATGALNKDMIELNWAGAAGNAIMTAKAPK